MDSAQVHRERSVATLAAATGDHSVGGAMIEYRHSQLWPTEDGTAAGVFAQPGPDQVDEHMKGWVETGWQLESAQTVAVALGPAAVSAGYVMHSFFWSRDSPDEQPARSA